jgi:threonine dehydratase
MEISAKDFDKAYEIVKKYVSPTPLVRNDWLSKRYGANIYLKLENMQPVGSFKLRGATNKIASLSDEEKKLGVLAVSAGNHAQGVAWAASKFGVEATIIMPVGSPLVKIANTEALGAKVILKGENVEEGFAFAKEYQKEHRKVFVHPFEDPLVIAGQGSISYELKDQLDHIDCLIGSIGGGGLLAGIGHTLKRFFPECKIIGTQARGSNALVKALQTGRLDVPETAKTFADGIRVRVPRESMYNLLDKVVDDAIDIADDKIALSVLELMEQARVIAEGAGAITLAAFDELYQKSPRRFKGKNIVLLICGGNIDINLVDRIIDKGLMESRRRIKVQLLLDDRPGSLMRLSSLMQQEGANILQVVHDRDAPFLALQESIVDATLETKGPEHAKKILKTLGDHFKIYSHSVSSE